MSETLRREALACYLGEEAAARASITPLGDGLINETFLVQGDGLQLLGPDGGSEELGTVPAAVLQWVNPIFGIAVHEDIEAVTRHLAARGLPTPLLYRTLDGRLAVTVDRAVYRLMSFVPGHSPALMTPALCREAGRLVGRFHAALADLDHAFRFSRPGAHDLKAHLAALDDALRRGAGAPPGFAALAEEILERGAALPAEVPGPLRVCHGDLKASNIRFDDEDRALCLVDLDTLGRMPLVIELGDALRSWCNAAGEDDREAAFDLNHFELAVRGYAEAAGGLLLREEREGLVAGLSRIALELAARFCADVVNDRYFRYDPARFSSRAAHNLVRACGQLSLHRAVERERAAAEALVRQSF